MAWQDEMDIILRAMIDDLDATKYTDDRIEQLLVVGARFVTQEMNFVTGFEADVVNVTITPDPTVGQSRDESFINLTCLKTCCIMDKGEAKTAAQQAINIIDNGSRVDLTEMSRARLKLIQIGNCEAYEQAKLEYLSGQIRQAGAAIMTPFRVFAGDNANVGFYPYQNRSPYNPFP